MKVKYLILVVHDFPCPQLAPTAPPPPLFVEKHHATLKSSHILQLKRGMMHKWDCFPIYGHECLLTLSIITLHLLFSPLLPYCHFTAAELSWLCTCLCLLAANEMGKATVYMYKNVLLYCRNELSWRYQTLLQSLERKKTEVEQLSQEFESKIRAKEV